MSNIVRSDGERDEPGRLRTQLSSPEKEKLGEDEEKGKRTKRLSHVVRGVEEYKSSA